MNAYWRQRRPRGRRAWAVLAVVSLMAVLGVDAGLRVRDARAEARAAVSLLDRTHAALRPLLRFDGSAWPRSDGYAELRRDMGAAEAHLRRTDARLGYLQHFAGVGRLLPRYGETVRHSPALLDFTITLTDATNGMLAEVDPLFDGGGRASDRARAVFVARQEALDAHLGVLEGIRGEAGRLAEVRWRGPLARAGGLLPGLHDDLSHVSSMRLATTALGDGLEPLLGYDGPRTYILLGQNEQEIRPTGGFIGTMGVIRVTEGRVESVEYASVREFDPRPDKGRTPPHDLSMGLGIARWYVRDANWWPWFPESARAVQQFLREDRALEADGVIAVDTEMLRLLLKAFGPMTVEGIDRPLTAENFYVELEDEIFADDASELPKKRTILSLVLEQSIDRLQGANAEQLPGLLTALHSGAGGRHLQMFGNDGRVQEVARALSIDGTMRPRAEADFLAVVDANVSYSKLNAAISREITYLRRADGRVDVFVSWRNDLSRFSGTRFRRLSLTSTLFSPMAYTYTKVPGLYVNLFRVVLPQGSTVESVEGFTPTYRIEQGMTVLIGRVEVSDGEQETIAVTYRPRGTPAGVDVWKQGGQQRDRLRVLAAEGRQQVTLFDGPFSRDTSVVFPVSPTAARLEQ